MHALFVELGAPREGKSIATVISAVSTLGFLWGRVIRIKIWRGITVISCPSQSSASLNFHIYGIEIILTEILGYSLVIRRSSGTPIGALRRSSPVILTEPVALSRALA